MKRSEKGVLGIILAATLMIGATAVVSANGGTLVDPASFASKGKIQVKENETDPDPAIVIDSADLVTLANATNELNTQFTDSLAAAVNNIGSVPKTDRVAAGAQFSDILSAITNSQAIDSSESVYVLPNGTVTDDSTAEGVVETQITGATEANLSAGTAAWVDGQLIVGTGADNNSYYAQGKANATVNKVLIGSHTASIGTSSCSFNCKSIQGWQSLTSDNFSFVPTGGYMNFQSSDELRIQADRDGNVSISYDNSTGNVTVSGLRFGVQTYSDVYSWVCLSGNVYCYVVSD